MFRFLLVLVVVAVLDGVLENTVVVAFTATTPSIFSSSSSSSSDDTTIKGTTLTNNSITTTTTTTTTTRMAATTKKLICSFDDTDFSGRTIWPYTSADLNRLDNSVDTKFYDTPRLVTHIDDTAIQSLSDFYRETFTEYSRCCMKTSPNNNEMTTTIQQLDVLDLCSSWISHFPSTSTTSTTDNVENNNDNNHPKFGYGTVVGLGMNQEELEANPQLTRYLVQDLNTVPNLHAFDDASFDVVTMTVSIDYLIRPLDVVQEIYRVLKPSGRAIISFGNRCFATKAVAMWLQADPLERITIVASYFHYAQYQQGPQSQQPQDEDATTTNNTNTNNAIVFRWNSIECYDLKDEPQEVPKKPSMQALLSNPSLGVAWMNTAAAVQKTNNADPLFVIQAIK